MVDTKMSQCYSVYISWMDEQDTEHHPLVNETAKIQKEDQQNVEDDCYSDSNEPSERPST